MLIFRLIHNMYVHKHPLSLYTLGFLKLFCLLEIMYDMQKAFIIVFLRNSVLYQLNAKLKYEIKFNWK
jgi:hypothetical protein